MSFFDRLLSRVPGAFCILAILSARCEALVFPRATAATGGNCFLNLTSYDGSPITTPPPAIPTTLSNYDFISSSLSERYSWLSASPCLSSFCLSSQLAWWSTQEYGPWSSGLTAPYGYFWPQEIPACSRCEIFPIGYGSVQVMFWPTPAISGAPTTWSADNGAIYSSPTPVVAMSGLSGPGTVINSWVTFAVNPTGLSSLLNVATDGGDAFGYAMPFNFEDLNNCGTITTRAAQYMTTKTEQGNVLWADRCLPVLSVPSEVIALYPAWASCTGGTGNVYDPPTVLQSFGALIPQSSPPASPPPAIPVTTQPAPLTSDPASPAGSATHPAGFMTTVPSLVTSTLLADPPPHSSPPTPSDPPPSLSSAPPVNNPDPSAGPPSNPDPPSNQPAPPSNDPKPTNVPTIVVVPVSVAPGITANPVTSGVVVVGSQTVSVGADPITVSNAVISAAPSGGVVVVASGSTLTIQIAPTPDGPEPPPPASVSGIPAPVQRISSNAIVIGSQTATVGGAAVTVSNEVISADPSGNLVIISSGSTFTQPIPTPVPVAGAGGGVFTIGAETFTVLPSAVVFGGQTLTPGAPGITVSGELISLGSSDFVVGTHTETFSYPAASPNAVTTASTTSTVDIGDLIMSGIGQVGGQTDSAEYTSYSTVMVGNPTYSYNPIATGAAAAVSSLRGHGVLLAHVMVPVLSVFFFF